PLSSVASGDRGGILPVSATEVAAPIDLSRSERPASGMMEPAGTSAMPPASVPAQKPPLLPLTFIEKQRLFPQTGAYEGVLPLESSMAEIKPSRSLLSRLPGLGFPTPAPAPFAAFTAREPM